MKALEKNNVFQKMREFENAVEDEGELLSKEIKTFAKQQTEDGIDQKTQAEIDQEQARLNQGADTATSEFQDRTDLAKKKQEEKEKQIAEDEDITLEQAKTRYVEKYRDRPYIITRVNKGQKGPMVEFEEHGRTIEVYLNEDHRYFKNVYASSKSNEESEKHWDDFWLSWADIYFTRTEGERDFLSTFLAQISEQISIKARFKKKRDQEDENHSNDMDDQLPIDNEEENNKIN